MWNRLNQQIPLASYGLVKQQRNGRRASSPVTSASRSYQNSSICYCTNFGFTFLLKIRHHSKVKWLSSMSWHGTGWPKCKWMRRGLRYGVPDGDWPEEGCGMFPPTELRFPRVWCQGWQSLSIDQFDQVLILSDGDHLSSATVECY